MLEFLALAFVLGFKHSLDADHLIAVSSLLQKVPNVKTAIISGLSWASGHMLSASIITLLLFTFRETILTTFLSQFETAVGIILIIIGTIGFYRLFKVHTHAHTHGNTSHNHPHMHRKHEHHTHKHLFGIGVIQGIASNDELFILLSATLGVSTLSGILSGLGFFTLGIALGMLLFTGLLTLGWRSITNTRVQQSLNVISASISIGYGISMLV